MPPTKKKEPKKKKKYTEKYYALPEEEMQDLINAAKQGDSQASLELLTIFRNFLSKYVALLYYGRYSLNDYDIRRFLSLFVKDKTIRSFLNRNQLNASGVKHVNEVMRGIQYMIQRYGDEEDVEQTINMAFLHCLSIYKRKGKIPFSAFLYSYFFFVLKKMVDAHLIDQLGRKTFPLIDDEDWSDSDSDSDDKPQGFAPPPEPGADELIFAEMIDEYWVLGETCEHPFTILTMQERQLLRWRYVDRERSSEIAQRITEHPNTVREHFNRIRKKIQEEIDKDLKENV